jgi:DNA mismatch repair protein MutS
MNKQRQIDIYFDLENEYRNKYGDDTLLLYQNGKFFEIYGIVNYDDDMKPIFNNSLNIINLYSNLNISKKGSTTYNSKDVYMAGPPVDGPSFENLKDEMTDLGITVIVHFQDNNPNNPEQKIRTRHEIYTSGIKDTSNDEMLNPNTNPIFNRYLCCISFYPKLKLNIHKKINVGISLLSLTTNKTFVTSVQIDTNSPKEGWSKINSILQLYPPKEMIIYKPTNITYKTLEQLIHVINNTKQYVFDVCREETHSLFYCKNIINDVYNKIPNQIPAFKQYETISSVTHSFAKLLEKIQIQCTRLLNNIQEPINITNNDDLFLGNSPLVQLNIIESGLFNDLSRNSSNRSKSLYNLLSYHKTPLGKRKFYQILTQPTSNINILKERLNDIQKFQSIFSVNEIQDIWKDMNGIHDFILYRTKLSKNINKNISMQSLVNYYRQIKKVYNITNKLQNIFVERNYENQFSWFNYESISKYCNDFIELFENRFDLSNYDFRNPESININYKFNNIYTDAYYLIEYAKNKLSIVSSKITEILSKKIKRNVKLDWIDYHYLEIAEKTFNQYLKPYIQKNKNELIIFDDNESIKISEYEKIPLQKKNKIGIYYNIIDRDLIEEKQKICEDEIYKMKMDLINFIIDENNENISEFVALLDCMCNNLYLIREKCYELPELDETSDTPYIDCNNISHPIIKYIDMYTPYDVLFNNDNRGILLYGVNESGKSSLMKAIGMNIILAQCGLPVCCEKFRFHPYKKLYTRIQSQDNFWLGQSTFNIEMSELNPIIRYSDDYTLVLADELCSGTENESANRILLASLIWLSRRKSHFLFTTHFHELKKSPHITNGDCEGLNIYHIPIKYDKDNNRLEYCYKLVEGYGEELYGMMVARANHFPDEFMDLAETSILSSGTNMTRTNRFPDEFIDLTETATLSSKKNMQKSRYNGKKRMFKCEVCGVTINDGATFEIDHLLDQKYADEHGIIKKDNSFIHKNDINNLVCVCTNCHREKTKNNISYEYVRTNRGNKLIVKKKENNEKTTLKNFVLKQMNKGERIIRELFIKLYPDHPKPSLKKIRKIKEETYLNN